jgi:uncharacterized protein
MNVNDLIAIDVHTHAEVSCRQPTDANWQPFEEAANKYFKAGKRPTIAETIAYYRERKIGFVMFTVDSEFQIGNKRIPNEEVAAAAAANSDIMIAFASIDPHKGRMGVREARGLIETGAVRGFKFHPTARETAEEAIGEAGLEVAALVPLGLGKDDPEGGQDLEENTAIGTHRDGPGLPF